MAWAATSTSIKAQSWFVTTLRQGLSELREFEEGRRECPSLQSVLWRLFCARAHCGQQVGWVTAMRLIEQEHASKDRD